VGFEKPLDKRKHSAIHRRSERIYIQLRRKLEVDINKFKISFISPINMKDIALFHPCKYPPLSPAANSRHEHKLHS
jgi:hypothetical protein